MPILLLLTSSPDTPQAITALQLAQALARRPDELSLFFYQDAVLLANALRWQPADRLDLAAGWVQLAREHGLDLPVCVSAALQRGIADAEQAARHQLTGANLRDGFRLTGLGELIERMQQAQRVIRL